MQARDKTRFTNRGFTLIETIIVLLLLAMLLGVAGFVFVVSLRAWDAGRTRGGIREDASYAMEKVVRDLKEMAIRSLSQYSSIAHTVRYNDFAGHTYVFYLYNADDAALDSTVNFSHFNISDRHYSLVSMNFMQLDLFGMRCVYFLSPCK